MDKYINVVHLLGWLFLQFSITMQIITDLDNFKTADITYLVILLRIVQTLQVLDLLLILIGKASGSLLGSFAQIFGRLLVTWYFVEYESHSLKFAVMVILWSFADIIRYLYYLLKNVAIVGWLRYNCFLILYPTGIYS